MPPEVTQIIIGIAIAIAFIILIVDTAERV
jgi:hypothetical protein